MKLNTKRQALSWDQEYKPRLDQVFSELTDGKGGDGSLSNTEQFMICLSVGWSAGVKRPVPPRKTDSVRLSYIDDQIPIFRSIAIADSGSADILLDDDKVLDIIESYAAAGLEILVHQFDKDPVGFRMWFLGDFYNSITTSPLLGNDPPNSAD